MSQDRITRRVDEMVATGKYTTAEAIARAVSER